MTDKSSDHDNNKQDLACICARYCHERPLRPVTIQGYTRLVERFMNDTNVRRVDGVTREILLAYRDQVVERSSPTTYNNYHRHLRALLNFCVDQGLIDENPILKIKPFTRVNVRRKGCTQEDLETLCQFLESDTRPLSPIILNMVLTLFYTAMRRAQLCGLIWQDIDFGDNTILLRKQHSKNGREWRIALHNDLRDRLVKMKQDARERFPDFSETDQVFWIQRYSTGYSGERLTPDQFAGILRRAARRSGVRISAHMIRHLVATTLANQDPGEFHENGEIPATLNTIKDFLGHESISTTIGYIEARLSTQRQVIKGLEIQKIKRKGD